MVTISREEYARLLNIEIQLMKTNDLITILKQNCRDKAIEIKQLKGSLAYLKKKKSASNIDMKEKKVEPTNNKTNVNETSSLGISVKV